MDYRVKKAVAGVYFCGNEASDYAKENGYLDYSAFARSFDAVLNNDIMNAMENAGFYFDPIQDGTPDHSDEIDELREEAQELEDQADAIEADAEQETDEAEAARMMEEAEKRREEAQQKNDEADDLEAEQEPPEIFQFFIVSDQGAELIQQYTDDPLFYCSDLDMYIWGITHWGTSWTHVLTDIKLNAGDEAY